MPILDKVRVLDLTRVVAGPWCTQTLADLGADVIKIERPGVGDDTRKVGPFVTGADGQPTSDSAFFMGSNRGKRSLTLDIASPEGAQLARELAAQCDVFIENYKVGALARYGLDFDSIRAINPAIIYCSVTGYGQDGPYAPRPAYDSVMQAMCGLMSTCGPADGEPGAAPMRSAVPIADIFTGLYAAIGILAAIIHRRDTGEGQYIDAAMMDVTTAINAHLALGYLMTGKVPQRQGNNNPITAPSEVFRGADGHFTMSAANAGQFDSLLRVLGLDPALALAQDERLSAANVPCAPIYNMQQLFADPHVQHRNLVLQVPHGSGVDVPLLRSPLHLSAAPVEHRAPPTLGQHSAEVLQSLLGKTEADIARLRAAGVV